MPQLTHCIYASAARHDLDTISLGNILDVSRRNNQCLGITGVLLYAEGSFFQVLEGEKDIVDAMCAKICADPRHTKITEIISEAISQRTFTGWSMGFSDLSGTELAEMTGVSDFASWRSALPATNRSRARKLLDAFCEGRWRMKSNEAIRMQPV